MFCKKKSKKKAQLVAAICCATMMATTLPWNVVYAEGSSQSNLDGDYNDEDEVSAQERRELEARGQEVADSFHAHWRQQANEEASEAIRNRVGTKEEYCKNSDWESRCSRRYDRMVRRESNNRYDSGVASGKMPKGFLESQGWDRDSIDSIREQESGGGGGNWQSQIGAAAGAAYNKDYLSALGSFLGLDKLSDSASYTSTGKKGRLICAPTGNKNPTQNEKFRAACVGVPTSPRTFVVPLPPISVKAGEGGSESHQYYTVSITWHKYWVEFNPVTMDLNMNTYGGTTGMSAGADYYGDFSGIGNSFAGGNGLNHDLLSMGNFKGISNSGSGFGGYDGSFAPGSGTLNDSLSDYYANKYNPGNNRDFDIGGNGNYGYLNNGGNYNFDPSNPSSSFGEGFNSGQADWANSNSGGGMSADELGNYFGGNGNSWGDFSGGSGSFGDGSSFFGGNGGYGGANGSNGFGLTNDLTGMDHGGADSLGLSGADVGKILANGGRIDNLGNVYNSNGELIGTAGDAGLAMIANGSDTLNDILANGGRVDANGNVYDSQGNLIGHVVGDGSNMAEFAANSPELNKILAEGGWVDEYGNVHDANGNIVGHVSKADESALKEGAFYKDQDINGKFLSNFQDMLASMSGNNADGSLVSKLLGGQLGGNVLDSFKATFGLDDQASIAKNTMTPQEMYDMAAKFLRALGYNDGDIANGFNYDPNSAYTTPEDAWDMNRITTLQKNFKIDTKISKEDKRASMMNAANNFQAIQDAQPKSLAR